MTPSDGFRDLVMAAIHRELARQRDKGHHPDELLRREVSEFMQWLAFGTWGDLRRLEETSLACASSEPDSGRVRGEVAMSRVEVSRVLGIAMRTVDRLVATGELPSVTVGRRRLIQRVDLDEFLERRAADAQDPA